MLTQQETEFLNNVSNSQREFNDNCVTYLTYKHHFNNNPAVTLANTYSIKGKPSMNTSAMYGAVRRSGMMAYMRIVKLDDQECILATRRRDELQFDIDEHMFRFTIKDAERRNLLNQRAWKTMPKSMLYNRCLSALLRAFYPEIIGTTYSPDELAEVMIDNENERDAIVFQAADQERLSVPPKPSTKPPTKPPQHQTYTSMKQLKKEIETVKDPNPNHDSILTPILNPDSNPFPRLFQSVEMIASEALINIDLFNNNQIDALAKEIKEYLMGVVFDVNPKNYIKVALSKLKIKEYQMTIDVMRSFYSEFYENLDDCLIADPQDEISKNCISYIKMNTNQIEETKIKFIEYLYDI